MGDAKSAQVIIPGIRIKRPSDIYISANVYTKSPKQELMVAYKLLAGGKTKVLKEFFMCSDTYFPTNDPRKDGVFITSSMDATTHFESATREVQTIYKLVT